MSSLTYTWTDKSKAVQFYMLLGNLRLVSEKTEVPYKTLVEWKRSSWWPQLVQEMREAKRAQTGTKLSEIIDTSLDVVLDRLKNGDFVLNNKTGQIERRKVSLRDASAVTNNLLTRQLQMEELADRMEHTNTTVQETLNLLAREFQKLNRKASTKDAETVEYVEVIDALDDKRETRLQERSSEVYEQAGSEEEESLTKCS